MTREEIRKAHSERSQGDGWGIFPRTVLAALDRIRNPQDLQNVADSKFKVLSWTFSASVIEMYFGEIKDLLNSKKVIPMKMTSNKNFDFNATKQMRIKCNEDLSKLIDVVFSQRQSRGTLMNDSSSRSHCITSLFLSKILVDESGKKFVSQAMMQFVDLSGSERTIKTGLSGTEQIKGTVQGMEGIMINIDLWALGV